MIGRRGMSWYFLSIKSPKIIPKEMFGLISQMRRCAVSITLNLAEGFSRQTYKDKVQFYSISMGSLTELQNQLLISKDIGYLDTMVFNEIANMSVVVQKLITGLIKKSREIQNS